MAMLGKKRQFSRVVLPCHLRYLRIPRRAAEYQNATLQDIGAGGLRFHSCEQFTRKSCFLFDVYLPGADPIRSLATVAWVRPAPARDGYIIGGKFVEPNAEVGSALARLASRESI